MAGSSPAHRNSYNAYFSSPGGLSDILDPDRNSEARHRILLEKARREHERVRAEAEKVYQDHLRKEEQARLQEERLREEERIRREESIAAERKRLQALKDKKVEIPPLPPKEEPKPKPPVQTPTQPTPAPSPSPFANAGTSNNSLSAKAGSGSSPFQQQQQGSLLNGSSSQASASTTTTAVPQPPTTSPATNIAVSSLLTPPNSNPFAASVQTPTPSPTPAAPAANAFAPAQQQGQTNGTVVSQTAKPAPQLRSPAPPDRYETIHKTLKQLRRFMLDQAKTNRALKDRMGDMRRDIRKCVGQLIHGPPGANRSQLNRISQLLRESLANAVQSQLVDPSGLVLEPRNPVDGALNNSTQLPTLFLYLLNIFAKAAISQFINEAGAKPETADPVGVTAAAVFSEPDFLWRDKSLIDILLAKFRVVCPVLFGSVGNEKYEEGRRRLGWHKEGGQWVTEQQHTDRMTGLGAGFAAISLRNFGKSKKKNPFPPSNYWSAMSRIVNTKPEEISNTQAVVLKAMIQHYEQKFVDAYGSAGVAALRVALVDFPGKAPVKSAAINSLEVHAQLLKKETGLSLA